MALFQLTFAGAWVLALLGLAFLLIPDPPYLVFLLFMGPTLVLVGSLPILQHTKQREAWAVLAAVSSLLTTFIAFEISAPLVAHERDFLFRSVWLSIPLASLLSNIVAYKLWRSSALSHKSLMRKWWA